LATRTNYEALCYAVLQIGAAEWKYTSWTQREILEHLTRCILSTGGIKKKAKISGTCILDVKADRGVLFALFYQFEKQLLFMQVVKLFGANTFRITSIVTSLFPLICTPESSGGMCIRQIRFSTGLVCFSMSKTSMKMMRTANIWG
jgi:hypothetical protein